MAGGFDYTSAPKARRLALFSAIGLGFLCVLSQLGLNTERFTISFFLVPTLAIYLWPQGANSVLSLMGIATLGLFQDHLSFGPVGLWPLTWLILFLIYRPDMRAKPETMLGQWFGALIVLVCVVGFQFALGRLILATPINGLSLIVSAFAAFLLFPLIYVAREFSARAFGGREDYYYERPIR